MAGGVGIVESVTVFPLTGARGNVCTEGAELGPGGFAGDHAFVLYGPNKGVPNARISQKQEPTLAQINASVGEDGSFRAECDPLLAEESGDQPWSIVLPTLGEVSLVEVIEFGDATPCEDMGDDAATRFSELLQREVRLARKTRTWQKGGVIPPEQRATATVHVALQETVAALASGLPNATFGPDRTRAQLIVSGFESFDDARWVGGMLLVGSEGSIGVDRLHPPAAAVLALQARLTRIMRRRNAVGRRRGGGRLGEDRRGCERNGRRGN